MVELRRAAFGLLLDVANGVSGLEGALCRFVGQDSIDLGWCSYFWVGNGLGTFELHLV